MVKSIPFSTYDFFGYLSSGFVALLALQQLVGFPEVIGRDHTPIEAALLVLAAYVAGQLVADAAKALLEDGIVHRLLRPPSVRLLSARAPRFLGFIFLRYFKPLPPEIRDRIVRRARREGVAPHGESLFLHVRFHSETRADGELMSRLATFVAQYGFARNLCLASLGSGTVLLLAARWLHHPNLPRYGDHMRGVRRVHAVAPIQTIWDCGVAGSTTDCAEYAEYMRLRREVRCGEVQAGRNYQLGGTTFSVLGGRDSRTSEVNTQSAVIKVGHGPHSAMLTGDSDVRAWRWITSTYPEVLLASTALLASHHGSMTFFEEPEPARLTLRSLLPPRELPVSRPPLLAGLAPWPAAGRDRVSLASLVGQSAFPQNPRPSLPLVRRRPLAPPPTRLYTDHLRLISPQVVIVSVGRNTHGHPERRALDLYDRYTTDPPIATLPRVCRTDRLGMLRLELDGHGWIIRPVR